MKRPDRPHPLPFPVPMPRGFLPLVVLALLAAALPPPGVAQAEPEPPAPKPGPTGDEDTPEPLLTLTGIEVEPSSPGPETLCQLTVEVTNRGDEAASALVFTVEVAGQELPVYEKQVFLKAVPPGETVELALYNFWSGETGRPAPADGELPVEVTLREARWMEVGEEDEAEVWSLEGPVEHLPSTVSTVLEMAEGNG
ncbi:MAG: hypothetical protein ACLF0P_07205 [Thermoanaerobaculia bacterium]